MSLDIKVLDKNEKEIYLKQDLYDDEMGFNSEQAETFDEPQVMTGLDGYTLEEDPDDNNMVDENSFAQEDSYDEDKGEM